MKTGRALTLLCCLRVLAGAAETLRVSSAETLQAALRSAKAGTTILIAPGEYRGYFSTGSVHGTAESPIVIAGADPAQPPVLRGTSECLHLSLVSHVILRDLVLASARTNGLNIDDGGTITSPSHHVVLDRITVRDIGPRGNRDGIKLSGVEDFLVRRCIVERWGSDGSAIDMVGCHRGLITDSTFRHDEGRGASGIQAKGGSCDILVYRCRFQAAGQRAVNMGGSTGAAYLRPKSPGYEAKQIVALGNTFIGSMAPVAFVSSDECSAAFNTVCRPTAYALRILQEARGPEFVPCRNGVFQGNLVVWRWRDLRVACNVGPNTAPDTFRFSGNWWYCEDRPTRSQPDLPTPETDGVVGQDPGIRAQDLSVVAPGLSNHGAGAKRVAEEAAKLGPRLAPWAWERNREMQDAETK
jgi:hypothetical protein